MPFVFLFENSKILLMKQKWIYKTINIGLSDFEKYVSLIKQGYCVFNVNESTATYLSYEFESYYQETKDDDFLFEYAWLLKQSEFADNKWETVISILMQLVERKYIKAYSMLGVCFYKGYYVEQDYEKAFNYFSLAAQEGYAPALNNLSLHYLYGYYVEKDKNKAFELMKESADLGYDIAQANVAYSYLEGDGPKQNYELARHYAFLAADQGLARAYYYLGRIYLEGLGAEKDYDEGFYYMYKAALKENKSAKRIIEELGNRSQLLYQSKWWYKIDEQIFKD